MENMWLLKFRSESDYSQISVQSGILSTEEGFILSSMSRASYRTVMLLF